MPIASLRSHASPPSSGGFRVRPQESMACCGSPSHRSSASSGLPAVRSWGPASRSAVQIVDLSIGRWLKSEGDDVASGDVLCEIRLSGRWSMRRPTTAMALASIKGRGPVVRQIVNRERVRRRRFDGVGSLVAGDSAVLRKVLRDEGETVRPGELIAVLSGNPATPVDSDRVHWNSFRVVFRTDDSGADEGRAANLPGRESAEQARAAQSRAAHARATLSADHTRVHHREGPRMGLGPGNAYSLAAQRCGGSDPPVPICEARATSLRCSRWPRW